MEKWCSKYESDYNALAQYGWQNNVILSGIPELVSEDVLANQIEISPRKQLCFLWTEKTARKFYLTRTNWENSKHNFIQNTKIFANENLTPMNESIAYNCRKLKHNGLIHGCFSRDGIVRINHWEKDSWSQEKGICICVR